MEIKEDAFYSINEALKYINWSKRKLQRYAQRKKLRIIDKRYLFTGKQIKEVIEIDRRDKRATKLRQLPPIDTTISELIREINDDDAIIQILTSFDNGNHIEEFSQEEYQKFIDRLKEANYLEERIAEYKEEIERMQEYVIDYRNNIEYLKKSLDKQNEQMDLVLHQIRDRNIIEATEKKVINKKFDI